MNEFNLITDLFSRIGAPADNNLHLGVGDDAAVFSIPQHEKMVMSVDTVVSGVHFPEECAGELVGYRSMITAISDLAAMGATPCYFALAISIPKGSVDQWLPAFAQGVDEAAKEYGLSIIGGDTTRAECCVISIQVYGRVKDAWLVRSGAQVDDDVYVSGLLGQAAGALPYVLNQQPANEYGASLVEHYFRPKARIELGQALIGLASSCLDLSDGLIQDVSHLLIANQLGCDLETSLLPMSDDLLHIFGRKSALSLALAGGDDYELCFTASTMARNRIADLATELGIPLTRVGKITASGGVRTLDNGVEIDLPYQGYQHF